MDVTKLEELRFIASFIRSTAQANIACAHQQSTEFYVMLRAASQELSKLAKELDPDKTVRPVQTVNEQLPELDEHCARYQAWFEKRIKPRLG